MRGTGVLVVDDDQATVALVRGLFEGEGAEVVTTGDALEGLRALYVHRPDLVLIEIAMPGGWTVLERIRELDDVPILALTAGGASGAADALRAGADDYVTKPFSADELVARGEALLRRSRTRSKRTPVYSDGLLTIDPGSAEVYAAGKPLELTPLEFRLLTTFVQNPNRVLAAEELLAMVWGEAGVPRARVKLTVGYLREKFRRRGIELPLKTVRGFGYRYTPIAAQRPAGSPDDALEGHLAKFEHLFAPLEEIEGPSGQRFFPSQDARIELARTLDQSPGFC